MKKAYLFSVVSALALYSILGLVGFGEAASKEGGKPGGGSTGTPNAEIIFTKYSSFMVANPDGSSQSTVLTAATAGRPSWTPDGSGFLFGGDAGQGPGIYYQAFNNATGFASGSPVLLRAMSTASDARAANPVMSPVPTVDDKYKIVFTESQDTFTNDLYLMNCGMDLDLFPMNCDSSDVTRLTLLDGYSDIWPKWSPSGDKLVVVNHDTQVQSPSFNLHIIDLALSPTGQVIEGGRTNLSSSGVLSTRRVALTPDWSPNGDFIVASVGEPYDMGGKFDLYMIPVSMPFQAYNLTNTPDIDENVPIFSPYGTQILHRVSAASDPCVSKGRKTLNGLAVINVDGSPFGSCQRSLIIDGAVDNPDWR